MMKYAQASGWAHIINEFYARFEAGHVKCDLIDKNEQFN